MGSLVARAALGNAQYVCFCTDVCARVCTSSYRVFLREERGREARREGRGEAGGGGGGGKGERERESESGR